MSRTYYTKCGREFKKSVDAGTTGYLLKLDIEGNTALDSVYSSCVSCPFKKSVTTGWPPVHSRWECRAGSLPPNHNNEYSGSMDDKLTIHVKSLDHSFLEAVLSYCKENSDLSAGYNQDLEDCRRVVSVSCSLNKKGVAAKKKMIDVFFNKNQTGGASEQSPFRLQCPYLSSLGSKEIGCHLGLFHFKQRHFETDGEASSYYGDHCCGDFEGCSTYSEFYTLQMEGSDKNTERTKTCGRCCNNTGATGLKYNYHGTHGFCQVHKLEKSISDTSICQHFNRVYRPVDVEAVMNDAQVELACVDGCEHLKKGSCSIEDVKGGALKYFVMHPDSPDCRVMNSLKFNFLSSGRKCSGVYSGCSAIRNKCAIEKDYCCYFCGNPCSDFCALSKDLVPFGLLREGDRQMISPVELSIDGNLSGSGLDGQLLFIRRKSKDIVSNYVEIGFALLEMRDKKLYLEKGYDSLVDCVDSELDMKKSTCYNLIKVAEKFGDADTRQLKPEFSLFNYVQCIEMSTMTQEQLKLASPDMSKRDMQGLKKSSRLENVAASGLPVGSAEMVDPIIELNDYKVFDVSTSGQSLVSSEDGVKKVAVPIDMSFVKDDTLIEIASASEESDALAADDYSSRVLTLETFSSVIEKRCKDMTDIITDIKKRYKLKSVSDLPLENCESRIAFKAEGYLKCLNDLRELFFENIE